MIKYDFILQVDQHRFGFYSLGSLHPATQYPHAVRRINQIHSFYVEEVEQMRTDGDFYFQELNYHQLEYRQVINQYKTLSTLL